MKRSFLSWLGALLAGAAGVALAHAHLQSSTPADHSRIATPPNSLVLSFSEPARLTALWIEQEGGAKQKVTDLPSDAARQVSVALPRLAPGSYTVSFRALSADGHVVPGQTHFTLAPAP
jgi:methionine-rich copper-binding protein CopC